MSKSNNSYKGDKGATISYSSDKGATIPYRTLDDQNRDGSEALGEEKSASESSCCHSFQRRIYPTGFSVEAKLLLRLSWPLILAQFCQFGQQPVILVFAGRLEKVQFDAVALSGSVINAVCQATTVGLATACETLFSQTHGTQNKKLLGIYFQRSILIQLLAVLPVCALLIDMEYLLVLLGQEPEVAKYTARYLLLFSPAVVFLFMYVVLRRFMECQNIVIPHIFIGAVGICVNAALQYLLVFYFDFQMDGSVLAQDISVFLMFALTFLYMYCRGIHRDSWNGWTIECLYDWGAYMRLAFPGFLMLGLMWWAFEFVTFLAGLIGTTELAAQSVCFQLDLIQFMIPFGISSAVCIRVGQALGANDILRAITAYRVGFTVLLFSSLTVAILMATLSKQLAQMFTNIPEVIDLASQLIPIVAVYCFFDCLASVYKAVLRGGGKQKTAAIFNFVCLWCIGFAIGIPVMFLTSWKTKGLWTVFCGSLILLSLVYFVWVEWRLNWFKLAEEAQLRAGNVTDQSAEKRESASEKATLKKDPQKGYGTAVESVTKDRHITLVVISRVIAVTSLLLLLAASILIRCLVPVQDSWLWKPKQHGNVTTAPPTPWLNTTDNFHAGSYIQ